MDRSASRRRVAVPRAGARPRPAWVLALAGLGSCATQAPPRAPGANASVAAIEPGPPASGPAGAPHAAAVLPAEPVAPEEPSSASFDASGASEEDRCGGGAVVSPAGGAVPDYDTLPQPIGKQVASFPAGAPRVRRTVRLRVVVSTTGDVTKVDVECGDEPFATEARALAASWHFRPALRHGVPVVVQIPYAVRFTPEP